MIGPVETIVINASCLSGETVKYIYNQSYQLAWNYGLLMLGAGLLFGAIIGIAVYRYLEGKK